ncbi:MAG: glutamate-5-semialdehyde dehydrogenase [Clostridia bacterium]|nr:glutamate-5-semialdehyde dehydrogenase [Clostridia bacterium]
MTTTQDILIKARDTVPALRRVSAEAIDRALLSIADALIAATDRILEANARDVAAARGRVSEVMIDRLTLTAARIEGMARGIREIAALPSPLGRRLDRVVRPNGLVIEKVSVAMGVIAIIYESRPNVTSDAAALCIKSGNAVILRGGRDAYRSSKAIVDALRMGCTDAGFPADLVCQAEDTTRQSSLDLMHGVGYIDLLIPRGGKGLIKACVDEAKVPCIETGTGICHVSVDKAADFDMAVKILVNAKTSRPSVCNAAEVCLVHRDIAAQFLPILKKALVDDRDENPVELILDSRAAEIIPGTPAGDDDFDTEFLDYRLAVGVVDTLDDAIAHIAEHSTHHSEAIVTADNAAASRFLRSVDSAAVYHNASTRFTDGGEFGLGCEMGISTQKLHARGPMGLRELCTYKYVVRSEGNVR